MRRADAVCALVLLLLAVVVTVEGVRLGIGWGSDGPRAGFFVFYLGVILSVACAVTLGRALLVPDQPLYRKTFVEVGQLRPVLIVLLPAAGVVFLTHWLGLYVAGALYIAAYMRGVGRHAWPAAAIVSLAIPLVSFLVFEVWFLVPMPKGPLE